MDEKKESKKIGTDYRKLIIALVIAVLFSVFVFALVEAVYPQPEYTNCYDSASPDYKYGYTNLTPQERDLEDKKIQACTSAYEDERNQYEFIRFIIMAIVGVLVILAAMFIPAQNTTTLAIVSGLLLGGLFVLFAGTISGWSSIGRIARPIIILVELLLVIWVAYKKFEK
jgi:uncharacterized protein YqhQ